MVLLLEMVKEFELMYKLSPQLNEKQKKQIIKQILSILKKAEAI